MVIAMDVDIRSGDQPNQTR